MKLFLSMLIMTLIPFFAHATATVEGGRLMTQEYTYDFAVDGGAVGAIDIAKTFKLPVGTYIESGYYAVQTAFVSTGSATIAIGNATTAAKYLAATAYDNSVFTASGSASVNAIASGVPHKVAVANDGILKITIAGAAVTAGKMKVWLKVYKPTAR